jgi:hypothetical protein
LLAEVLAEQETVANGQIVVMEHVWFEVPSCCGLQVVVVTHALVVVHVHADGDEVGLVSQLPDVSKQEVVEVHDCVVFQFAEMHLVPVVHVEYVLTLQEDSVSETTVVVSGVSICSKYIVEIGKSAA